MDSLPIRTMNDIVRFQKDCAPVYIARMVANYLNDGYPYQWLTTNGPIRWPARSADLYPLDLLWGHLKNIIQ